MKYLHYAPRDEDARLVAEAFSVGSSSVLGGTTWGGALLAPGQAADSERGRHLIEGAAELAREHGSGAIVRDAEAPIANHASV